MAKRDYYDILGIAKTASADEIKKAFRRLAVKYHPDKQGGDEAKFKEANEAYEVLSNPDKRQRYDQFGHAGVGGGGASEGFGGFGQGQNVHFDFGDMGLGDIFGSFFGGGPQQHSRRGQDVAVSLALSFEEAVFGIEKEVDVELQSTCEHCKGNGAAPGHDLMTCKNCHGSGQATRIMNTIFGQIQQNATCDVCHGRGKMPEKACHVCHGKGVARARQKFSLKVPAGIDDGSTIRLSGRGEAVQGGERGDMYVNIRVKPHKKFTREGKLILSTEHIDMITAALGGELEVDTVDGPLTMKIPAGAQSGTDFKLAGHGVPSLRSGSRGDHIVTLQVETPVKLTKKQKELLLEFRKAAKKGFFQ